MKKRLLSLLLVLCMALSLLPGGATAANKQVLYKAYFVVIAPKVGYTPSFAATDLEQRFTTRSKNADGYINGVQWRDVKEGRTLTRSDTFQPGHTYRVYIQLEENANCTIAEDAAVTINSKPAERVKYQSIIEYHYTFPALSDLDPNISSVALTVTAPVADQRLSFDVELAEPKKYAIYSQYDGGFIDGVKWVRTDRPSYALDSDDRFTAGSEYKISVELADLVPYEFEKDAAGNFTFTATVNGRPAEISTSWTGFPIVSCVLPVESDSARTVSRVEITAPEPVLGQQAVFTATIPAGQGYELYDKSNSFWEHGVGWYDGNRYMKYYKEPFTADHVYTVKFLLRESEGWKFARKDGKLAVTATVNGQTAEINDDYVYDDSVDTPIVAYTFPPLTGTTAGTVDSIALTATPPEAGKAPDFNVQVPAGAHCRVDTDFSNGSYLNGVRWKPTDDGVSMTDGKPFEPGRAYEVRVYLFPEDGYEFDLNALSCESAVTVNGQAASGVNPYADGSIRVDYVFPQLEGTASSSGGSQTQLQVIGSVSAHVDEPAAGQVLAMPTVTTGNLKALYYRWELDGAAAFGRIAEAGTTYRLEIYAEAPEGYQYTDHTAILINGSAATLERVSAEEIAFCYDFTVPLPTVSRVEGVIAAPVAGQKPGYEAETTADNYRIAKVVWWELDAEKEYVATLTENDTFKPNTRYQVWLTAEAAEGYAFADGAAGYINGAKSGITKAGENWKDREIYTSFKTGEVPAARTLTGLIVDPPAKTSYAAGERFAPAGMTVTAVYSDGSKVPVAGYDLTVSDPLSAEDTAVVVSYAEGDDLKAVAIPITVTAAAAALPFEDVTKNDIYYDAVAWVYANGIMSGYSATTFGPKNNLTRAMVVQVLYNKEKKPEVTAANPFGDVLSNQWYFHAVLWGAAKNVVAGFGGGLFKPDDNVTVEQVCVILHNWSGKPIGSGSLSGLGAHSDWAEPALRWATANGILKDVPFANVNEAANRAQTAQMLANYLK